MIDQDKPMKFRDPKTGKVYGDIEETYVDYCKRQDCCKDCDLLPKRPTCRLWAKAHPVEAARLMGYEVVEDHVGDTTEKVRPRICEVLGVEVGEWFSIGGYPADYGLVQVCEDGKVRRVLSRDLSEVFGEVGHKIGSNALYYLLNHPDRIIRKPCFTEDEEAAMRVLLAAGVTHLVRDANGGLRACEGSPEQEPIIMNGTPVGLVWKAKGHGMADRCFLSLLPGQSVALEEALHGQS